MKRTTSTTPQKAKDIKREWHLVDASAQVLGRTATQVASWLSGKHKSTFAPYLDSGDYVVVTNAARVKVTGSKDKDKMYTRYSGYPGGLKERTFGQELARNPEYVVRHAVMGMLPKNKLRDRRIKRLQLEGTPNGFPSKGVGKAHPNGQAPFLPFPYIAMFFVS